MVTQVSVIIDGEPVYGLNMKQKTFKTGSKGYYVWGKATDSEGKRYQVIMNLVEIGSKPKKEEK